MEKHTIRLEDIKGFATEIQLAGSYGKGADKSLIAQIIFDIKEILFKVTDHNNAITTEQDLEKAIEIYNEL